MMEAAAKQIVLWKEDSEKVAKEVLKARNIKLQTTRSKPLKRR